MWPRTDSGVGSSAAPAQGTRGVGSSEMDFGKAPLRPQGKCLGLSTVQVSHPAASPPHREGAIPRSNFLLAEVPSLALGFLWPCSYVLLLSFDFSPLLSSGGGGLMVTGWDVRRGGEGLGCTCCWTVL